MGTLIQTGKPTMNPQDGMMSNSLKLQLQQLGVETETETIDFISSILHTLSMSAKIAVFNTAASHLKIQPPTETETPENDLPH